MQIFKLIQVICLAWLAVALGGCSWLAGDNESAEQAAQAEPQAEAAPELSLMSEDDDAGLLSLANAFMSALSSNDFSAVQPLLAGDLQNNVQFKENFNSFCRRLQAIGPIKSWSLAATLERTPLRAAVYKVTIAEQLNGKTVNSDLLFALTAAKLDGKLVIVEFKPIF